MEDQLSMEQDSVSSEDKQSKDQAREQKEGQPANQIPVTDNSAADNLNTEPQPKTGEEDEEEDQLLQKEDIEDKRKVIVILEQCPLQTAKIKREIVLLNSDDHRNYIENKLRQDYSKFRPDIVHQSLLTLMDSPLNKAGFLQVYLHTDQNTLIRISPNTKIPRTFRRFSSLIAQLLTKLKIRAV